MKDRGYVVRGRVQGVGFRWWTRGVAQRLGVSGTVRNMPDGTVEIMARGPDDALDRLATELLHGPPMARVDELVQAPSALPDDCTSFTILT